MFLVVEILQRAKQIKPFLALRELTLYLGDTEVVHVQMQM